jgi:hypothetical protein
MSPANTFLSKLILWLKALRSIPWLLQLPSLADRLDAIREECHRLSSLYESIAARTALLEELPRMSVSHTSPKTTSSLPEPLRGNTHMSLMIEVAAGELIDKLTILEIKLENISDPAKLSNVRREYDSLLMSFRDNFAETPEIIRLTADLKATNKQLWQIEDDIREHERKSDFGAGFVELARSVYRTNDRRAAVKRHLNELLDSAMVEEKSYSDY